MKEPILHSLCYFDIFNHPLKREEILLLCGTENDVEILEKELKELTEQSKCFEHQGYFGINHKIESQVLERVKKEKLAKAYVEKMPFYVKLIKSFPFVRAISISGSLSKGVMHEDGDIDYFIITKKNRLWICRTLLVLFKKTFLLNSKKFFCVNYFVDEDNLEIVDKNIFTAVEVSHLVPVYHAELVNQMKNQNPWIKNFFPAFVQKDFFPPLEGNGLFKQLLEGMFFGALAEYLDLLLMRLTYNHWKRKFKNFNPDKLELTMRSNRGISKHHPSDYQTKVLHAFQERIEKLKIEHEDTVYT